MFIKELIVTDVFRFRLLLNDGEYSNSFAMLATQVKLRAGKCVREQNCPNFLQVQPAFPIFSITCFIFSVEPPGARGSVAPVHGDQGEEAGLQPDGQPGTFLISPINSVDTFIKNLYKLCSYLTLTRASGW